MRKKAYKRFQIRLISMTLLVALVPLLVLAATLYFRFAKVHNRQLQDHILSLAEIQAGAVDRFLQQQTALLATIADTHEFESLTRQGVLTKILATLNRRSGAFMDLALIKAGGRMQAYAGPFHLKGLGDDPPWFAEAMANGSAISDLSIDSRKLPHFIIAVRRLDKIPSWILAAAIDPDAVRAVIRSTVAMPTGDAFLVNRAGTYQTRPRGDGQMPGSANIDMTRFEQQTTVIENQDSNGDKFWVAGSWLSSTDWMLVITRPAGEGIKPLLAERNLVMIIIFFGLIVVGLVAFVHTTVVVNVLEDAAVKLEELETQLLETYKLAALGKIAADIVHEINNPIAVISEKAGWMKDLLPDALFQSTESRDEFQTSITNIEQQVQRIQKIVRNILGFARRMEDHMDEVNVNTVLDQTAELMQDQARVHLITIHRNLDSDLPVIAGDPSQLQQVFANLIHNAVDAIGKNGSIYLTSRRTKGFIEIVIRDDGPGIPHDQLGKIFDAFYTTKPSGKGTGLGLSICHTIVKQMGGAIRVDSTEGKGTSFTVRLPATLAKMRSPLG